MEGKKKPQGTCARNARVRRTEKSRGRSPAAAAAVYMYIIYNNSRQESKSHEICNTHTTLAHIRI